MGMIWCGTRTLNKQILFISNSASAHNTRFIKLLESHHSVTPIFLDETDPFRVKMLIQDRHFDLLTYSPISIDLSKILPPSDLKVLGICLAYEINELSREKSYRDLMAKNLQKTDFLLSDSAYISEKVREIYDFNKTILVAKYGCDIHIFSNPPKIEPRKIRILVTRNWTKIHGNELILEALAKLDNAGIEFTATFIEWKESDKRRTALPEYRLGKVNLINFQSPMELSQHLHKNWLYISASTSDGSSVSMLEALANGNIVLVSDFITNLEIINNKNNGFVFKNKSAQDLYLKILEITKFDISTLKVIAGNAKRTAREIGNWESESSMIIDGINFELESEGN